MHLKVNIISTSLRLKQSIHINIGERIEQYNTEVKIVNTATVLQVGDDIARIYDLDEIMAGELVEFEKVTIGIALNLE